MCAKQKQDRQTDCSIAYTAYRRTGHTIWLETCWLVWTESRLSISQVNRDSLRGGPQCKPAKYSDTHTQTDRQTDLIAWTTTTLNSSGISDMNDVICFISRSTLLSLPVYSTNTLTHSLLCLSFTRPQQPHIGSQHVTMGCTVSEISSQHVLNAISDTTSY